MYVGLGIRFDMLYYCPFRAPHSGLHQEPFTGAYRLLYNAICINAEEARDLLTLTLFILQLANDSMKCIHNCFYNNL